MTIRQLLGILGLLACLIIARQFKGLGPASVLNADETPPNSSSLTSSASGGMPLLRGVHGLAGCSARACHGGPETDKPASPNAFTHWINNDKHSKAYGVLFGKRSIDIAKNLGVAAAHEDWRCLACHSVPLTVLDSSGKSVNLDHGLELLRVEGVGCEACHGPSEGTWYRAHTSLAWSEPGAIEKNHQQSGMAWLNDLATRAQTCAGCHVGAPPEPGIPLRDVNHDLIAAGHPRLNFELASYQANLTPHWQEKDRTKPMSGQARSPAFEARVWLVGQIATAQASVRLLRHQASPSGVPAPAHKPWPELTQYDCFACHHDLAGTSWRQQKPLLRSIGSPPMAAWNISLPLKRLAAARNPKTAEAIQELQEAMSRPLPDCAAITDIADKALRGFDSWLNQAKDQEINPAGIKEIMRLILPNEEALKRLSWDEAAQTALALDSLVRALPEENQALTGGIRSLCDALKLERGSVNFDSPRRFRQKEESTPNVERLFQDLRISLSK